MVNIRPLWEAVTHRQLAGFGAACTVYVSSMLISYRPDMLAAKGRHNLTKAPQNF